MPDPRPTCRHLRDGSAAPRRIRRIPRIPGHEFVGIVESGPPEARAWIGVRVVGEINIGCGRCRWCAAGSKEHCDDRAVAGIRAHDGAFAEIFSLPAGNLHAVPDTMDDETAVFVEPTAAACRVLEQIAIDDRTRVAVLGDGRMGLLVAQVVRTATPEVIVLGRHEHKLAVGRELGLATAQSDSTTRLPGASMWSSMSPGAATGCGGRWSWSGRCFVVLKTTFAVGCPIASR
jgi:alcohol dehydrogenase